jgi:hypothetical protein
MRGCLADPGTTSRLFVGAAASGPGTIATFERSRPPARGGGRPDREGGSRAMTSAQGGADGGSDTAAIRWRVSSWCAAGDCVAVGRLATGHVLVTDTKDAEGPQLRFDASEWRAFVAGVRAGEFDD